MTCIESAHRTAFRRLKAGTGLGAAAITLLLAGCSAEISQSDFPGFNLADNNSTGSIPRPSEPMRGSRAGLIGNGAGPHAEGAYVPPVERSEPTRFAALDDAAPPQAPSYSVAQEPPPERSYAPAAYNSHNTVRDVTPRANPEPVRAEGGSIIVKPGDTLYGLSKRHGVGINELMAANGLTGSSLKPGQELKLPSGSSASGNVARALPARVAPAAGHTPSTTGWQGSHTVAQGESLYGIARQHNIKTAELQAANGITDPRKVRPGTVLKVPGSGSVVAEAAPAAAPPPPATPTSTPTPPPAPEPLRRLAMAPTILNAPAPPPSANDAPPTGAAPAAPSASVVVEPPAAGTAAEPAKSAIVPPIAPKVAQVAQVSIAKLRWPVQGKVVSGFGPRPDGTHNDGVNVSVPMGTEVHVAEEGTIAYAGSELKGYGNLVLVRHDNGWVTAYAHADEILVKRGDRVKRGQVIARAGKTGQVDQPQLHFELRQGSTPVDPTPYMENL